MVTVILVVYVCLLALLLGSFYNLAADRMPRRESLVRPRSHCRACGRELGFVELIPVVGYMLLRGHCAGCGARIGLASPVVEFVSLLTVLAPMVVLGMWPGIGVGAVLNVAWGALTIASGFRRLRRANDPD